MKGKLADLMAIVAHPNGLLSCVENSEKPLKSGGERGIRTPDTAFDRITV
jgi:hypothetical protein